MTPFRNEKNSNWEGAYRVPAMVRWPGQIEAGSVSRQVMSHMDWLPTLLAAAGDDQIKEKLKKGGVQAIGRSYKVHLDGYNFLPFLTGKTDTGPAPGVLLLLRRRRPHRPALRQLEGRLRAAARHRHPERLERALHLHPDPLALQPPHRSLREGDHDVQHLLGLVPRSRLPAAAGVGLRREVPGDLRGVPAAAEGGELHDRPGAGEAAGVDQPLVDLLREDRAADPPPLRRWRVGPSGRVRAARTDSRAARRTPTWGGHGTPGGWVRPDYGVQ